MTSYHSAKTQLTWRTHNEQTKQKKTAVAAWPCFLHKKTADRYSTANTLTRSSKDICGEFLWALTISSLFLRPPPVALYTSRLSLSFWVENERSPPTAGGAGREERKRASWFIGGCHPLWGLEATGGWRLLLGPLAGSEADPISH